MGILGNLFSKPQSIYQEAYEKGVLLGRNHFDHAYELFEKASQKARKEGDSQLSNRAGVNAALYRFLSKGDNASLQQLHAALAGVDQLETIGSATEYMTAEDLRTEVEARIKERQILEGLNSLHDSDKATRFLKAAETLAPLSLKTMKTYQFFQDLNPNNQAKERSDYYYGKAYLIRGQLTSSINPDEARNSMRQAISHLKQCHHHNELDEAKDAYERLGQKRICWNCHREFQGRGLHFDYYRAYITEHMVQWNHQRREDQYTVDESRTMVVLCKTCSSATLNMADEIAVHRTQELKNEVLRHLDNLNSRLKALESEVYRLKKQS